MASNEELEEFLRKVDQLDAVVRGELTEGDMRNEKTPVNKTVINKDAYKADVQSDVPLTAICVPRPRVASNDASQATVRKRTKLLEKTRDFLSGGSSNEQLNHELSHANLQRDLHSLNKSRVMIPASEFLGLKADMCSSWKRNRELKRWLKRYGVHTECEEKLRQQQAQIIGDNLLGEWLPFLFEDDDGTVVKSTPCVRVKDLKTKIIQQIEGYERLNLLTWHGIIPEDEVWVKIGGDKGGATFKQMFQVANVESPNAPRNTIVFCIFPAKDSIYNLKLAFQSLQAQVNTLQETTWRGKKFRIFGFGDYEYLCKMYGLAGASGRHCCLWCTETKSNMKLGPHPDEKPEARTLATLRRDLERYHEDGARPNRMKFFNNVIEKPQFDIPIDQVCIPGLHISLGLFLKHFNAFEAECHKFDLKIASTMEVVDGTSESKFQTTVEHFSKARALEEQASELEETAMLLREHLAGLDEDDVNNGIYTTMIADHLKEKENLLKESQITRKRASSTLDRGPIVAELDEVLQGMKVQRQAYHGKSFVGNHIHRCCQKQNINRITSTLPEMVQKLNPQLLEEALKTASKFNTLFRLFAACHKSYNASSVFSDEDIKALETFLKSIEADATERAVRRKEKTKIAVKLKEEGNKAFKEGDYETAVKFYSEGLAQIKDMVVLYTNRAQAYLHLKRHTDAIADCETALLLDSTCIKAYVHKGRALVGQKQYDQAVTVYTAILKHHPNKRKLVDEYIRQAQQAKDANAAETKAHQLFLEGDTHASNVVDVLEKLRSEGQPTVYYGGGLTILAEMLKDDVSRTLYRTNCGLNIFTENRTISSGIQKVIKGSKAVTELELVLSALDVMDRSIIGNDENLSCLFKCPFIPETVFGLMSCGSENIVYKCVILLLKMSFQPVGLTGIIFNFDVQRLVVFLLTFIQKSNVGTKEGAALLCNIAEDKQFVKVIRDGIEVTILPALENVMVNHRTISDGVMSSCLSFISTMAHDCLIRKKISERSSLTKGFIDFLSYHGNKLSSLSSQSMLHLVLGLLMNVTIDRSLSKEQSESLAKDIMPLLHSTDKSLLEKSLIMISRLVPQSPALVLPLLINAGIPEKLQQNFESGSTDLKKPSIRLLALLTQGSTDLRNSIAEDKADLERICMLLDEDDDHIIANTALCLGHCFEVKEAVEMVEDTDIVRTLLKKTDTLNGTVKQNCAIALAKLAMANQRHLERVRELGGIGILHSCMKYVK